jgi:hypothetical protein
MESVIFSWVGSMVFVCLGVDAIIHDVIMGNGIITEDHV